MSRQERLGHRADPRRRAVGARDRPCSSARSRPRPAASASAPDPRDDRRAFRSGLGSDSRDDERASRPAASASFEGVGDARVRDEEESQLRAPARPRRSKGDKAVRLPRPVGVHQDDVGIARERALDGSKVSLRRADDRERAGEDRAPAGRRGAPGRRGFPSCEASSSRLGTRACTRSESRSAGATWTPTAT